MPEECEALDYDCALAASLVIVEMLQTSPNATTPELVSFITFACLEAVREAKRRSRHALAPSDN
jgi:hypothetical protein